MSHQLYPLKLRPIYKDKIWGGRNLEALLGKELPPATLVGESWEVADEANVVNGPLAGFALGDLAARYGERLVGSLAAQSGKEFPLLIKFIDAHDRLSVQVHPDDEFARREGMLRGKTEAWYVLAASPDAEVIHGLREPAPSGEQLALLSKDGDVSEFLQRVPVHPGEVIYIPAGTVHAMGAGLVIYEVQQNCDVTYRLFDWQRLGGDGLPRELHIENAVAVSRHAPREHKIAPVVLTTSYGRRSFLVACRYFAVELLELVAPYSGTGDGRTCTAVSMLSGAGTLVSSRSELAVARGESLVIPAAVEGYELWPAGQCSVLVAYVPDLAQDVVATLRAAGVPAEEILGLGGDRSVSDLVKII